MGARAMAATILDFTLIIFLGIASQWVAWRIHMPSIPFLLLSGFIAGPIAGLINPDQIFGQSLFPIVSLAVALILFEGGLSLRLQELKKIGLTVVYLLTVGVLVSWSLTTVAAHYLMGIEWRLSLLLGAILVVTGPTVISPILRAFPIKGQAGSILKWEGIIVDSIGAVLAVLVFEILFLSHGGENERASDLIKNLLLTIIMGGGMGALGSYLIVLFIGRDWIPDFLHNPVSFVMVLTVFTISNLVQEESGLVSVTLMGFFLANQSRISIRHIVEFKENLQVLLLSGVFVLLSARIQSRTLEMIDYRSFIFFAVLVVAVRPLSIFISTIRSPLALNERLFLSWMAPRGIVAAAVSSVFALQLISIGYEQARILVPVVFMVIVGTVTLYGLTARPVAGFLNLAIPDPQGILFLGAQPWVRALARLLQEKDFRVVLVDTNKGHVRRSKLGGLEAYHGNILEEYMDSEIDFSGIGRLVALTSNDEVNALAAIRFGRRFGSTGVFQISPVEGKTERMGDSVPQEWRGRCLVDRTITFSRMNTMFQSKRFEWRATAISDEFDFISYKKHYGGKAIPFFLIRGDALILFVHSRHPDPLPGDTVVSVVPVGVKNGKSTESPKKTLAKRTNVKKAAVAGKKKTKKSVGKKGE